MKKLAILDWNMTEAEAEAFEIALIYEEEFRKMFNGDLSTDGQSFRRNTIPKKGDPRKCSLFKNCWKLRRETIGLLKNGEHRLYILANLRILKNYNAYIEPNAMCGDKAWIRWKVWKRLYDQKVAEINSLPPPPSVDKINPKILVQIDRTKKFLFEKCDGAPARTKIKEFIDNGFLRLWVMTGKVSPYYLLLSPFVKSSCDHKAFLETCSFDPSLIKSHATTGLEDYFKKEFDFEFSQNC